ncbi:MULTISPECIES: UDP-N-acetylmuramate dehydrogenase [unclassified Granulicatella]|uniref:UDP-N-acetylmuramate dehydrogenase n=1 Tax=unclassified Granulicatella TaxID=2630493 RepID=UPI0010749DA7|nr:MULTISPECIES: UDP-N-acetylmuramate dehydrogenase [unclassified Granulicatella]MBF0781016.1 UDP-N-acetylmuramate dehydrogenase [Granulicatella sp. 19428wC4_WM01]TFU92588.1 UDP-N-acetylmuramate dehydrogenase [Granulicatella sp. WM01]
MWKHQLLTHFSSMTLFVDEPLSSYTYTKTGGKADILAFPKSKEELSELIIWAKNQSIPITTLGNASNVIVKDTGIKGIVIMLEYINDIRFEDTYVHVSSGMTLIDLSKQVSEQSLSGLEFACGIPGSVGGAIYMNAGAYGGEMKDIVEAVHVIDENGQLKSYTHDEMLFDYRYSIIQNSTDIIIGATLKLEHGNKESILEKMTELNHLRQSKQPLEYPSCGSVFKRPEGYFAGKLIQDANLQGKRIGGVEVSKKHAGFMVNIDNGTATDYKHLIAYVQQEVKRQFNVDLETEVRFIGDENERN